jgi:hypothetical protein
MHATAQDVAFFVALLATALALGAGLAHALELPAKITLSQADYFTVQQIYAGWNRLAYLLLIELLALVAVAILYRHDARVLVPVLAALPALAASQALFWLFTFPANQATANWTEQPPHWELLRTQWEYSHLAGAACQALALIALIVAVLRR